MPEQQNKKNSLKILVIEDSNVDALKTMAVINSIVERHLSNVDVEIEVEKTLKEGLRESISSDLIILDLNLPDSSPYNSVSSITKITDRPIIVLSGEDDTETIFRVGKMGAIDFIRKEDFSASSQSLINSFTCFAGYAFKQQRERRNSESFKQGLLKELEAIKPKVDKLFEEGL